MKCWVRKTRKVGVLLERGALRWVPQSLGDLVLMDSRENGYNRAMKMAFLYNLDEPRRLIERLYDPHIVWMNEDRFVLAGFERVGEGAKTVEYAQSWQCMLQRDYPN